MIISTVRCHGLIHCGHLCVINRWIIWCGGDSKGVPPSTTPSHPSLSPFFFALFPHSDPLYMVNIARILLFFIPFCLCEFVWFLLLLFVPSTFPILYRMLLLLFCDGIYPLNLVQGAYVLSLSLSISLRDCILKSFPMCRTNHRSPRCTAPIWVLSPDIWTTATCS